MKTAYVRPVKESLFPSPTSLFKSVGEQTRAWRPMLLRVYAPALLVLGVVFAVSLISNIPVAYFLRDPSGTLHVPAYIGLISNLGALLWCACAVVCYFTWAVLRTAGADRRWPAFFFASGIITTVLLLDDLFMLHENASEVNWRLGEKTLFVVYGVMLVLFLGRFWRTIACTEYLILALAFVFMGTSLGFDQIDESFGDNVPSVLILLEDGAKFLGIVTWLVYFTRTCLGQATTHFARERLNMYVRPTEPRA